MKSKLNRQIAKNAKRPRRVQSTCSPCANNYVDDLHQQIDELQEQLDSLTLPITTKIGKEYSSSIRQVSYFLQVGYISLFVKGILQAENNLI